MRLPQISRRDALRLAALPPLAGLVPEARAQAGAFDISIACGADPISLDPRKTWVAQGYSINAHVFESLVFRREAGGNVEIVPVLAESWRQADPLNMDVRIRQGVRFHNGEALDAEAVAYTITSIMDPAFVTNLKTWTSDIERVTVTGSHSLRITTKWPTRGLLNSLAQVPIVAPRAAQEQGAAFERRPAGTGPYRIVNYVPNSIVQIERAETYWGEPGKPRRVTFRIMPENAVRLAALQAGEVQLSENLPPDRMDSIRGMRGLSVVFTPTLRVCYLVLNFRNPLMADQRFREAISLAVDRPSIVRNLLGGTTRVANSISPPGTTGYDASLPDYEFDPARARQLLRDSGYANQPINMGGPIGRYAMDKQVNEAMAGMLRAAGFNVRLETLAWGSYSPKYNQGGYDIGFIGQTDFTVNPHKHWNSLFYGPNAINRYSNPEMDRIIEAVREELDDEKAVELYRRGQALERRNFGGAIPLYYEPQLLAHATSLRGFEPRLDEYVIVRDVTLVR